MSDALLRAQDAPRIDEDWGSLSWVASRAVGNVQDMTLGRVVIKQGKSNPRHCHPACEEVIYLLSGRLEHTLGDATFTLEAGDIFAIPAGVFHNGTNIGDTDADMIIAYSAGERGFVLESDAG
mgnify:CR=1 FL=1